MELLSQSLQFTQLYSMEQIDFYLGYLSIQQTLL